MRFYTGPVLAAVLAALSASGLHAQASGSESSKITSDVGGSGANPSATPASAASELHSMHRQSCTMSLSESKSAKNLADILLERAWSAWDAAAHEPAASREVDVERAVVRTLERTSECPIVTQRAVSLAREAFSLKDPSNQAFDLTLSSISVADQGQSCNCRSLARSGPAFGGPPLGDSGGNGGGVTHPPVASPQ